MAGPDQNLDFYAARRLFLARLHGKVNVAGTRVIIPVLVGIYLLNVVRYPCWQTRLLLAIAVGMAAAWFYAFAQAARGRVERSVFAITSSGIVIFFAASVLRMGAGVSTAIALIALMTYVALFSERSLYVTAAAGTASIVASALVNAAGWIPQVVAKPRERLLSEVAFVVVFAGISAYFLRQGQLISESLYRDMQATSRGQREVIATIERIEPGISGSVREILRISETFAAQAGEQAVTSRSLNASTERLASMVGDSASAVDQTRRIAEKTRDDAVASRERLDRVEAGFRSAVVRNEAMRQSIDELAEQIASTAEINEAIRAIAENLKVLAVNTSLEAARAGEHGKGFAVVASELQRLIAATSEDLRRSRQLLDQVRAGAAEISGDAQASTGELRGAFEELQATGALIQAITDSFALTTSRVDEVAGTSEEERARILEISGAMRQFEVAAGDLSGAALTLRSGIDNIHQAHSELQRILLARAAAVDEPALSGA